MEVKYIVNWLRVSLIRILHSKKKNAHFGLIVNFGFEAKVPSLKHTSTHRFQ